MNDSLAAAVADFLAHKRALGRKYDTEEATLRLLLAFAGQHGVEGLPQLTPSLLEMFVASRPRTRGPQLQPPRRGRLLLPRLDRRSAASESLAPAQNPATRDGCASAVPVRRRPGPPAVESRRSPPRQFEGCWARTDLPRHLRPLLRAGPALRGSMRSSHRRRRRRGGNS